MDKQLEDAQAMVMELARTHPQLRIADEMPTFQGCTNRILFGSLDGAPVVFKCFVTADRKHHEKRMLQLMAPSGTVPMLYPFETERILVMKRLPGEALHANLPNLSENEKQEIFRQIGGGFARITTTPQDNVGNGTLIEPKTGLDLDFYRNADLPQFYDYVVATGLRALEEHDIPDGKLLFESLNQLERYRDDILAFPTFIHQDDVHLNNLIADGGVFKGFIDLEMCRQGNEILLLAAARTMCSHTPSLWPAMRSGFEEVRGIKVESRLLTLIRATTAFSALIRFAWYWSDEPPQWAVAENMRTVVVRQIVGILERTKDMAQ